jgi:uncharacterized protein (TIGR03118 family)
LSPAPHRVGQARCTWKQTSFPTSPASPPALTALWLNPWGTSFGPGSPFWVSDEGTGQSTLYDGHGVKQTLSVVIPGGKPTGQVFNTTGDFALTTGGKALFLFATLNGTIAGWNPSLGVGANTPAQQTASTPGAVYTGLALGTSANGSTLYAADSKGGKIDTFNSTFSATTLSGSFADPNRPAGLTPYNIQNINGSLFVTWEGARGAGFIDKFDTNGNVVSTFSAPSSMLNAPWGVTLAPSTFGQFAGDLLVGNKGNGEINAFDPITGAFQGTLLDAQGNPIVIPGLWALAFGGGGRNGGNPNSLFFAAGIGPEVGVNSGIYQHGLFGEIDPTPETSSMILLGVGGMMLFAHRWKARGKRRGLSIP